MPVSLVLLLRYLHRLQNSILVKYRWSKAIRARSPTKDGDGITTKKQIKILETAGPFSIGSYRYDSICGGGWYRVLENIHLIANIYDLITIPFSYPNYFTIIQFASQRGTNFLHWSFNWVKILASDIFFLVMHVKLHNF